MSRYYHKVSNLRGLSFLRKIRDRLGLNFNQMALHLGVPPQTYHFLERRGRATNIVQLTKKKNRLKLSWQELGEMIEESATFERKD